MGIRKIAQVEPKPKLGIKPFEIYGPQTNLESKLGDDSKWVAEAVRGWDHNYLRVPYFLVSTVQSADGNILECGVGDQQKAL